MADGEKEAAMSMFPIKDHISYLWNATVHTGRACFGDESKK